MWRCGTTVGSRIAPKEDTDEQLAARQYRVAEWAYQKNEARRAVDYADEQNGESISLPKRLLLPDAALQWTC